VSNSVNLFELIGVAIIS